jgi:ssDNA thymidine ADP-ribosyltransferase, DarT
MPTSIYHMTHLRNLPSIIDAGGLIANNRLRQKQIGYTDIAHQTIQDRRATRQVPCGVRGVLHDYVPFYFAPRSPMLYSIHKRNVVSYQEGQTPVIYLLSDAESVASQGIDFTFTDGHAIMEYSCFCDDLNALEFDAEFIDWDLMESKYWRDTEDDPNRKCRRQAEFLVYQLCPWDLIREIGVINPDGLY